MTTTPALSPPSPLSRLLGTALLACSLLGACTSDSDTSGQDGVSADGGVGQGDARTTDAGGPGQDSGPCVPSADSLVCANSETLSLCVEDVDFDGESDGPPTTVEITCSAFFSDAGEASCETFDDATTEALCTMDDGGPCGVILVSGGFTSARCTTDDAVCLLDLEAQNYLCTANSGISCSQAGQDFVPFCTGSKLVWRCTEDGDGTPQPHVDDCAALGGGTCNATDKTCTGIQLGGQCNLTEWLCDPELKCESHVCVEK